jgi:hypothetical protein
MFQKGLIFISPQISEYNSNSYEDEASTLASNVEVDFSYLDKVSRDGRAFGKAPNLNTTLPEHLE